MDTQGKGTPSVSVITTTFNRSKLLKKAINSVLNQSMKDFELIIVDDCSTDDTEEVVKSFADKDSRIIYLKTPSNFGYDSAPKNIAIGKAQGEFICFLDDDDVYRPDALKILSTYMKESEADIAYADYLIGEEGKKSKHPGWSMDFSPNALKQFNFISMIVSMVRKSALIDVGGFDENVPKFKDWNLWIRLQKANYRFVHVPIVIADVEILDDSISSRYKVKYDENNKYLPILIDKDGKETEMFNPVDCKIYPDKTQLGERRPLKVAVYTLTWNRLELTKIMAESLKLAGHPFDWFVIDQGSTDGTVAWLKSEPQIGAEKAYTSFNEKNVGLANGWNQAIDFIKKTGQYDILIKVDNDAELLTEGWLKAMVEIFERNRAVVLSPYVEGLENSPGGVLRQRPSIPYPYLIMNEMVLGHAPNLGGIVFATPIQLWDEFKFNPSHPGNKDYFLSRYASQMGYSCFYMEEYRVVHQLGTKGQHEKYPDYFKDQSNDSTKK